MSNGRGASSKKATERKAAPRISAVRHKSAPRHRPPKQVLNEAKQQFLRDKLLLRTRDGEISPKQAEEEARAAGLKPLASIPDPVIFDPMKQSRWTLLQTIAWIAWRDSDLVMEQNPEYCRQYLHWVYREWRSDEDNPECAVRGGWVLEPLHPPSLLLDILDNTMREHAELPATARLAPRRAEERLWKLLADGHLKAEALDTEGSPVEVPALSWPHLTIAQNAHHEQVLHYKLLDQPAFTSVHFRRSDITSIWPPARYEAVETDALDLGRITEQHFGLMLSEEAYVPFSVAVCWIVANGGRKVVAIKDKAEWQTAAKSLLSHLAAAEIEVIGCGEDRESKSLSGTAFDSVDCPHPYGRPIQYELPDHKTYIRCAFYSDEEHWKEGYNDQFFLEGKIRPHWTHIRVRRDEVLEKWPPPPATSNLEVDCYKWLKKLMVKFKHRPKLKDHLLDEARDQFPGLSKNQSERAWARATKEGPPGWRRRGPVRRV
jgi:hypothetical protein